ncbi:MAG: GNAT family N-acetyltransferase [Planctomycetes bacterium]|nr:GNAT family N-acetyltransferase [Planctomycetota bacterium]
MLSLRQVTIEDVGRVGPLVAESWRHAYQGILPEEVLVGADQEFFKTLISKKLLRSQSWGLIASAGELLCGVALAEVSSSLLFISDFYVTPSKFRCGVGKALIDGLKEFARLGKLSHLEVALAEANHQAAAFYAAMGFVDTGQREEVSLLGQHFTNFRLRLALS